MKKKCKNFLMIIAVSFILFIAIVGCVGSKEINSILSDNHSPNRDSHNTRQLSDIIPTKNLQKNNNLSEEEFAEVVKYYDYFSTYGSRINPLFNFSADEASDLDLMVFAINNMQDNSNNGNTKEEVDAILTKFFGRTVQNYVTGMTEYVPGTNRIRSTGWGFDGSNRLVLTKLLPNGDKNFTGYFDVYHIPEMYGEEDHQKFWSEIDSYLLSGKPGKYAELLRYKAVINFDELPDEEGGFYLRYNNISLLEIESPL